MNIHDIDDSMSQLAADAKAAMAQAGKPTGFCGERWLATGSPFPACEICNDTGGIASASRCPECQP
jgi:hypothetical protein